MPCAAGTDGSIGRGGGVPAYVADFGVDEAFVCEVAAVEVLHAPETTRCYGTFLSVGWVVFRGCGGGV